MSEKFIPLSVPMLNGKEWEYIKKCLDTAWVSTAGKYVEDFETAIASFCGVRYAVACVNGTSALHISLILSEVKENDEVIVPTITFIAPINAVHYLKAEPVFMDADAYYNLDVEKLSMFLEKETYIQDGFTYNKSTKKRISAILPVHVFGHPCRMEEILVLAKYYNLKVIEDATESLGSYCRFPNLIKHTGSMGDCSCLSFNGNKIITSGGGGMILTNNTELAKKAKYLTTQAKDDDLLYIHNEVGYNYRMPNILAALGLAQLEQLPKFLEAKKNNYIFYRECLANFSALKLAEQPHYGISNNWFYALQIAADYSLQRDVLMQKLSEHGIQTRPLWQPNHLQKPYRHNQAYHIENALKLHESTLNLPCSSQLTQEEIISVCKLLCSF